MYTVYLVDVHVHRLFVIVDANLYPFVLIHATVSEYRCLGETSQDWMTGWLLFSYVRGDR